MMQTLPATHGREIVEALVSIIVANREYLSEIDGAIGDGDHGINMSKGFNLCGKTIKDQTLTLSAAFDTLADALMEGIGGSMGPLYGSIFMGMADSARIHEHLDAKAFACILRGGLTELQEISSASVGDKCLMDTLVPAVIEFETAVTQGKSFTDALDIMKAAAITGRDSTFDLVAKIGRASRLGERSKGALDAGATSCSLILNQLADSIKIYLV